MVSKQQAARVVWLCGRMLLNEADGVHSVSTLSWRPGAILKYPVPRTPVSTPLSSSNVETQTWLTLDRTSSYG